MGRFIAVIGSGGKTTTLKTLAGLVPGQSVLLTTTTHILPFDGVPLLQDPSREELLEALSRPGVVCAGSTAEKGKLSALSPALLEEAAERAHRTFCECDGSRSLPLKLHRPDEPVLPGRVDRCIVVAGLSALGKPVSEAVHRFERHFSPEQRVGVEEFLFCVRETITSARLPREKIRVLLNQADTAEPETVKEILNALRADGVLCTAASLREDGSCLKNWV